MPFLLCQPVCSSHISFLVISTHENSDGSVTKDTKHKTLSLVFTYIQCSCMASTLMLHVTKDASIYLENSWLWVADHDIDSKEQTRINIYGARGILIESQGPSWIQSVSNEHSTLYNWQLSGAQNIYMSQIQSETPYFQAGQTTSLEPYPPGERFADDPEFPDCDETKQGKQDTCREAWALRIINSKHVYLYGGGFYSFFKDYLDVRRPEIN